MSKSSNNPRPRAGAAPRPVSAGLSGSAGPGQPGQFAEGSLQALHVPLTWFAMLVHMGAMALIVVAMTGLTHNLDDIKITLFYLFGPVLTLIGLAMLASGMAPVPGRGVGLSLLAFYAVMFVSTLKADYRWCAWEQMRFIWAASGFFLTAYITGANPRTRETFHRFLVGQWLVVTLIGFFMVSFVGQHNSGVALLYRWFFEDSPSSQNGFFYPIIWTLYNADDTMQSTILNRDFFAGLCLLFLPFAMTLAIHPGTHGRHRFLWRMLGLVTTVTTTLSIYFCKSKGEYICFAVMMLIFIGFYLAIGPLPDWRKHHLVSWIGAPMLVMAVLVWMQSPMMLVQLKSLGTSVGSRAIMWSGAWEIFKRFPLLGGGPGCYRVYFSEFRSPDYYNHEISNVTVYSHNYFLDLLAEEGLLGFLAFTALLGLLAWGGLRWMRRHPDPVLRLRLLACLTGLAGYFGSNMSSPSGRWVIGATLLWTVMGLLAGILREAHVSGAAPTAAATPSRAGRFPWAPRATLVALLILGLWQLVVSAPAGVNYFRSAMANALGLAYMEPTYEAMEKRQISPDQAVAMLDMAAQNFEKALKIDANNMSAYYKVGSVYTTLSSMYQEKAVRAMQAKDAESATQLAQVSDAYLVRAKESYETLNDLWPDYAEIHYNMGIIYQSYAAYVRQQLEIAKIAPEQARLEDIKEANPDEFDRKAVEHLDRMGKLSEKAEVAMLRGEQLLKSGHPFRARDVFAEASTRYPADMTLAQQLLETASMVNDPTSKTVALRRMLDKEPSRDDLLRELLRDQWLHRLDQGLEESLRWLEKVNPLHPELFAYRARQAQRRGDAQAVLAELEKYEKVRGNDPEVYLAGIEAAVKTNQPARAEAWLNTLTTLEKDPNSTLTLQARQLLGRPAPPAAPAPAASPQ